MKLDKDHDGFLKMDHFASEYTQLIFERLGVLDLLEIRQIFTLANLRTLFSALDTDRGKLRCDFNSSFNILHQTAKFRWKNSKEG